MNSQQPEVLQLEAAIRQRQYLMYENETLQQKIESLQSEIKKLREANEAFGKRQGWWNDLIVELKKEKEALLGDAARYREFFGAGLPITFMGVEYHTKLELDSAIDAARKQGVNHD